MGKKAEKAKDVVNKFWGTRNSHGIDGDNQTGRQGKHENVAQNAANTAWQKAVPNSSESGPALSETASRPLMEDSEATRESDENILSAIEHQGEHRVNPLSQGETNPEHFAKFQQVAWMAIVRRNPVLQNLNAEDEHRLQIESIMRTTYQHFAGCIGEMLKAESDLQEKLKQKEEELKQERSLNHKGGFKKMKTDYDQKAAKLRRDFDMEIQRDKHRYQAQLDAEVKAHNQEISSLKNGNAIENAKLKQHYRRQLDDQIREIAALRGDFANEKEKHSREYEMLLAESEKDLSKLRETFQAERARLLEDRKEADRQARQELDTMDQAYAAEHKKLIEAYDASKKELRARAKAAEDERDLQIARLRSDHAREIENSRNEYRQHAAAHEQAIYRLKEEHKSEMTASERNHAAEMTRSSQENQEHVAELIQGHDATVAALIAEHKAHTEGLVEEVRALNKALLTRDKNSYLPDSLNDADTKQEPDERIKAKFSDIVEIVDRLSRLSWKSNQNTWTEAVLRELDGSQTRRVLKKHILSDTIWTTLHKHIFCSPFRIFGKEGEMLEEQWNEAYGQDSEFENGIFTWPKPGIETERWRYGTITECRKILMEPAPSEWDRRARLKKGFKTAKDALVLELKSTLDEMVDLNEADAQKVGSLVMRMANVWLEFGMHRCRFVIFLPGSHLTSAKEKAQKAQGGGLRLTVIPGLRRYGNVTGVELHTTEIVGGYEGECFKQA